MLAWKGKRRKKCTRCGIPMSRTRQADGKKTCVQCDFFNTDPEWGISN